MALRLIVGSFACSSGSSGDGSSGLAEGEACYMLHTSLDCHRNHHRNQAVVVRAIAEHAIRIDPPAPLVLARIERARDKPKGERTSRWR